jgi:hypothetical protein
MRYMWPKYRSRATRYWRDSVRITTTDGMVFSTTSAIAVPNIFAAPGETAPAGWPDNTPEMNRTRRVLFIVQ